MTTIHALLSALIAILIIPFSILTKAAKAIFLATPAHAAFTPVLPPEERPAPGFQEPEPKPEREDSTITLHNGVKIKAPNGWVPEDFTKQFEAEIKNDFLTNTDYMGEVYSRTEENREKLGRAAPHGQGVKTHRLYSDIIRDYHSKPYQYISERRRDDLPLANYAKLASKLDYILGIAKGDLNELTAAFADEDGAEFFDRLALIINSAREISEFLTGTLIALSQTFHLIQIPMYHHLKEKKPY
jgi:hypothetical protein